MRVNKPPNQRLFCLSISTMTKACSKGFFRGRGNEPVLAKTIFPSLIPRTIRCCWSLNTSVSKGSTRKRQEWVWRHLISMWSANPTRTKSFPAVLNFSINILFNNILFCPSNLALYVEPRKPSHSSSGMLFSLSV